MTTPSAPRPNTNPDISPAHTFADRHVSLTDDDQQKMLAGLGYATASDLVEAAVPNDIHLSGRLNVPDALSETDALALLRSYADQNKVFTSLIGQGWNATITPAVIRRNMIENPAWYTAYTPYQPEISQGRLEMLAVFQTMIADLTGCELANASLLDESTAAAEAMTMLRRIDRTKRTLFFVDQECHPQTIAVCLTRAAPLGIDIIVGDPSQDLTAGDVYGALLAQPGSTGVVTDIAPIIEQLHEAGATAAVTTDLLFCALATPPGELGADVVVGSAQRFGVPMGFGGPHAGFMATREKFARSLPGRLVGVSIDRHGLPAYRLALQTREQHIRRDKATSNICTAQALLANVAASYACWHGPKGLSAIANRINFHTAACAQVLGEGGIDVPTAFFDTITVEVEDADAILAAASERRINLRRVDNARVGITFDETTTLATVQAVVESFGIIWSPAPEGREPKPGIPQGQRRTTSFMTDDRFHRFQSEHEMLRWLRRLADRDLALDRTMIPLGSCTMKLNAAAEMEPMTWPEFGSIHPFAPASQTRGYAQLIADLEDDLSAITGYDAISLQPNAGSQGEYAGLLAIHGWHSSHGEGHRNVCLIPSSAHGTNAASAVMAGMRVVVVKCNDRGDIDLPDLRAKIEAHSENLAALMMTYPSTHGVYEHTVKEVCTLVHEAGGQVYTDGANLNALVGVAQPGKFGSDVSHLNLHKTFCIPHGGGGPGVGPIGVGEHLIPFLPQIELAAEGAVNRRISGAPFGSAGILPISWMYVRLMGPDGLRRATEAAVLAANYVAARLREHFPILYTGPGGLIAHECIIDIRPLDEATGIDVDDIAKRLADYGFHAPTMSFPVAGTLMIEPTESESLAELDRFCDAMIGIANEIGQVASGAVSAADSVLRNAPHTAADVTAEEWPHPYSRRTAAFPLPGMDRDKYFPPVGRVDNAHGDRNLQCSCPPLEAFAE